MKNLWLKILLGSSIFISTILLKLLRKKEIKKNRLKDIIGNTPMIYLKSLSEQTGKEIYVMIVLKFRQNVNS